MRMRRRFQPMLDSMPGRIAPSAVAGLSHVVVAVNIGSNSHLRTMQVDDTNMPQTGEATPITVPSGPVKT